MNGKELLEGLGHIDDCFVEEAAVTRRIPWRRWTAMAACLALVLCAALLNLPHQESGDITEISNVSSPAGDMQGLGSAETVEAVLQGAQYIRIDWTEGEYPKTTVITSQAELLGDSENCKLTDKAVEGYDRYDDTYFAEHDLLMLVVEAGSGSIRHEVLAIRERERDWVIDLRTIVPEVGTADMARWLILLEIPKDRIQKTDTITVENVK